MRGSVFFIVIALIFIISTTAVLFVNLNSSDSDTNADSNANNPSTPVYTGEVIQESNSSLVNIENTTITTTSRPTNPKTYNVEINSTGFSPSELKIKKGDSVIWVNRDYMEHTVTSDSGELDSGYLKQNKIYDHTFDNSGTFEYFCELHPYAIGKITVE